MSRTSESDNTSIKDYCRDVIFNRHLPQNVASRLFNMLLDRKNLLDILSGASPADIDELLCCLCHNVCPQCIHYDRDYNTSNTKLWYKCNELKTRYQTYNTYTLRDLEDCIKIGLPDNITPLPINPSFMKDKFHAPLNINAFFTDKLWSLYIELCTTANVDICMRPSTPWELKAIIEQIDNLVGHPTEMGKSEQHRKGTSYIGKNKKNTITILYKLENKSVLRKILCPKIFNRGTVFYKSVLRLLGVLKGRWMNYFGPAMSAICAETDKKGLIKFFPEEIGKDLMTDIFCAIQVSILSVRKQFTLNQQQHGGLNDHSKKIFDILIKSPTTNWNLISLIHPVKEVMDRVSNDFCTRVYGLWKLIGRFMADFLQHQLEIGVADCIPKGMMVPRTSRHRSFGTYTSNNAEPNWDIDNKKTKESEPSNKEIESESDNEETISIYKIPGLKSEEPESKKLVVDSTGWNQISGSWNNMVRQLRSLSIKLNIKPPVLFKCLKLTAGDQMQWAASTDKNVDPTTKVFQQLYNEKYLPWSALNSDIDQNEITSAIKRICATVESREGERDMEIQWLGDPSSWTTDTLQDTDMICGVPVKTDKLTAFILKSLGFAGSKPTSIP